MSDTANAPGAARKRSFIETLEIDTRLLGMIGAFVVLCLVFHFQTDGRFLTPATSSPSRSRPSRSRSWRRGWSS